MKTIAILSICALTLSAPAQTTKPVEQKPITIEFGNMDSKKPEVIGYAENLKRRTDNSSADYTTRYFAMINTLKIVGTQNLTAQERDLVLSVKQPTKEAVDRYLYEKEKAAQRVDERSASIAQWRAEVEFNRQQKELAEMKAKQEREAREAEERRQAEINRIEEKKADALQNQADALNRLSQDYRTWR